MLELRALRQPPFTFTVNGGCSRLHFDGELISAVLLVGSRAQIRLSVAVQSSESVPRRVVTV